MPVAVLLYNYFFLIQRQPISLMPVMAALATGYILGEGVGRLACISFGCCYGKPLDEVGILVRKILAPIACSYQGDTKKNSLCLWSWGCKGGTHPGDHLFSP